MKRKILGILIVVLLIVTGVVLVKRKTEEIANLDTPRVVPPTVRVSPVVQGRLDVTAHYMGSIVPFTRSDLSSRISGMILAITKREGDLVRHGELLVTIDDNELQERIIAVNSEVLATNHKLSGASSAYAT